MQRVLVIEDEHSVRQLYVQTMKIEGYEATGATNGKEARRLLAETEFDLVITDIIMPEEEGLETITLLRREKPHLPVIAVSGGARVGPEPYLDIARRLGACYTFTKPVDLSQLAAAARECLGNK